MRALSFGGGLALDIITTLLHILAIGLTLLRLYYRRSTGRLGWDDLTAALAVLVDSVFFALLWPFFSTFSKTGRQLSNFNRYWIILEFFFAIVCLCRMSISLAISRVFTAEEPIRRFAIGLAAFFGLMFVMLQITAACDKAPVPFSGQGPHNCQWTDIYTKSYLFINITGDLVLVGIPLYKLWRVRLPTRQRRLILGGFAAGLIPTIGVVFSTVFQLAPYSWEPGRTDARYQVGHIEAPVCVVACNLLVIITYFDNVRRRHAMDSEQAPHSLQRTETSETPRTRDHSLALHSNEMPPSELFSSLVLTEITGAYITVDAESSESPQSHFTSSRFDSSASEAESRGS